MNRYYPPTVEEVWDSFEWLMKSKLQEIEFMKHQMFKEIKTLKKLRDHEIDQFIEERFTDLCNQVEQESKQRKERKGA